MPNIVGAGLEKRVTIFEAEGIIKKEEGVSDYLNREKEEIITKSKESEKRVKNQINVLLQNGKTIGRFEDKLILLMLHLTAEGKDWVVGNEMTRRSRRSGMHMTYLPSPSLSSIVASSRATCDVAPNLQPSIDWRRFRRGRYYFNSLIGLSNDADV